MNNISGKALFGAMVAAVLLALYGYSLLQAIELARTVPRPGETLPELNPGIGRTLATVGGLVSALVIAELAITDPGKAFSARAIVPRKADGTPPASGVQNWLEWLSAAYVLVWILLGVAAFVVGEIWYPGKVPALTDFAQAWLGLAVAAAYSYFGIKY
jgi:hypothetical protein